MRLNRLFMLGMLALGAGCQGSGGVPNTNPAPSQPGSGAKAPPAGDAAAIRGVWLLVMAEQNGVEMGPEAVKGKKYVIGDDLVMHMTRTRPLDAEYRLDPTRMPKTIDITFKDRPDVPMRGIYELKGDELIVCLAVPGQDRPTEFKAPADSGRELFRFKKEK